MRVESYISKMVPAVCYDRGNTSSGCHLFVRKQIVMVFSIFMVCVSVLCGGEVSLTDKLKKINRDGDVTIVYEESRDQKRNGLTKFKTKWNRRFNYRYHYRKRSDNKIILTVNVKATVDGGISHQIFMPKQAQDQPWYNRLLMHEYDHVCISLDPRPGLLLSHLVSQFTLDNIVLDSTEDISTTVINAQINKRIEDYEKAVEETIQANYRLLDDKEVSNHGRKKIEDREQFFKKLYGYDNLKSNEFTYLDEVASFLKSEEYHNTQLYYLYEPKKKDKTKSPGD